MAKTIRTGALWSGPGLSGGLANPIHSNAGRLIAVVVSHAQATVQTVTFYDATSVPAPADNEILVLHVDPTQSPYSLRFSRDDAIAFTTGLCVAGANCDVHIWSVDYG